MKKEDIILCARLLRSIFGTTNAIEIAHRLQYEVGFVDAYLQVFKAGTFKDNGRNAIYINERYDNISKIILCAHELGHAVLNHKDKNLESEYAANLFAVALLFDDSFNVPLAQMSNYALQSILDININPLPNKEVITGILEKKEYVEKLPADKCIVDPLGNPISDINKIHIIEVREIDDWKLKELNKNPTDIYQLAPRRFEEFIAEILMRKGYKVELTPSTRDGGIDIQVAREDDLGSFLYLVQCKRYKPTHKVGVEVLRELYGTLAMKKATYGIVVTSSSFSQPAQEFQQGCKHQMSLKDFDSIKQWLHEVA